MKCAARGQKLAILDSEATGIGLLTFFFFFLIIKVLVESYSFIGSNAVWPCWPYGVILGLDGGSKTLDSQKDVYLWVGGRVGVKCMRLNIQVLHF